MMPPRMIIGITGGIGSGKSVVSRLLRLRGFRVYDCDYHASRIMEQDCNVRMAIIGIAGSEAYCSSGSLNRQYLADCIFRNPAKLAEVNSVVHTAVKLDLERVAGEPDTTSPLFVESAILLSSGIAGICRNILYIDAPQETRLQRVLLRNPDLDAHRVLQRMKVQEPEYSGLPAGKTFAIVNDGATPITPQLNDFLNNL